MESSPSDEIIGEFLALSTSSADKADRLPLWVPRNNHKFEPRHFNAITACEHCGHTIVALDWNQGVACTECNFDAHHECGPKVPSNCEGANPKETFANLNTNKDFVVKHDFYLKHFDTITFCNVCRKVLLGIGKQGYACSVCKYVVHEVCKDVAAENCVPTKFASDVPKEFCHYWIEGNLDGKCCLCAINLAASTIMFGYHCFWCSRRVCSECFASANMEQDCCDLGDLKHSIIPPTYINTQGNPDDISAWKIAPLPANSEPLIVFINKRSGGGMGEYVTRRLNAILNPAQIFDLSKGGPKPALKMLAANGIKPYRILACGGDGTAGWVFQAIDELQLEYRPPLAHLPLGTANDLSRVTGMGPKYSKEELLPIVHAVVRGEVVPFDRWTLDIETNGEQKPTKFFNNYFSIGVDAMIAMEFHEAREQNPEQFKSVIYNKVKYMQIGTAKLVEPVPDLAPLLKIVVDGQELPLPLGTQELLIINIQSYMAGTDPWGDQPDERFTKPQSYSDGFIEVVAVSSAFHLAQIQASADTGIRLAQAKKIEITYTNLLKTDKRVDPTTESMEELVDHAAADQVQLHVQADGEPWKLANAHITIGYHGASPIIVRK